ncbi:hypothetical protein [Bradyrhizobium paxllaeri]|uniref:hypothetical protein n=1 Tax=Bradyrhizobium paxllaeri TaxID=190148 RepID=UPI001147291D|nr:hypothetical protein [Bradyrhizobium paxllaeri]
MAGSLTLIVTKFTKLHLLQVQMLHDITIQNQEVYTEKGFWRLALGTFRNALSRMSIEGTAHELPATWHQHPGTGFLSQRD